MKSPIDLLQSLLIDFKRLEPDVKGLDRDVITIKKRFKHEGYGFLSVSLCSLGLALQQGLSSGTFRCPKGFERIPRGTIPKLFSGMFSEVFEPLSGQVIEDVNIGTLKNLYQILFLFKKLTVSETSKDKLHVKAVRSFFSNDKIAAGVLFPDYEAYRLGVIARFILPELRLSDFGEIACKHGPGAVSERLKANQKWSAVADSVFQDRFNTQDFEYDTFATSFDSLLSIELNGLSIHAKPAQSFDYGASRSSARLVSVDKTCTSRRTITVEPVLNQFIQQGLNVILRDSILKCDILSRCLALSDQTLNQKLALEGSLNGRWSTIDLKAASDLMSLKLVKLVFGSHDIFLRHAIDCRTTHVSVDDVLTPLSKFAGMGNALTFPVQSVVFAVIAISAILDMTKSKLSKKNLEHAARHIRVYGDDIVVDTKYAHQVVNWLKLFGLTVNENKSFLEGNFKESCGVDAYKGIDVTPIYVRAAPDQTSLKPSDVAGLVSSANRLWLAGLYEAGDLLKVIVEEQLGYALPLVSSSSGVLGLVSRQDASYATRWCNKLHQMLVRAPVLRQKSHADLLDGWPALLKFFHVPLVGRPLKHLQQTSVRRQLSVVQRWVPVRLTTTSSNLLTSS